MTKYMMKKVDADGKEYQIDVIAHKIISVAPKDNNGSVEVFLDKPVAPDERADYMLSKEDVETHHPAPGDYVVTEAINKTFLVSEAEFNRHFKQMESYEDTPSPGPSEVPGTGTGLAEGGGDPSAAGGEAQTDSNAGAQTNPEPAADTNAAGEGAVGDKTA